jgi:hypothetical protein
MDPLQKAQNEGMPTSTTKTLDLTEDQRTALFGGKECSPGEDYVIKLRAGDMSDGGGQTFSVVSTVTGESEIEAGGESENEGEDEESMSTMPPAEEPSESSEAEVAALGYDRSKFTKKKPAPKISARDLEFD